MKTVKESLIPIGVIVALGVAFYLMCAANPLRWDDLMYQYVWLTQRDSSLLHPIDLTDRVDNFNEALISQCHHYMVMNGRFIVHFITQCFCGFLGKPLFNVINALFYVLFLYLAVRFVKARSLSTAIFTIAVLWFGLPGQWILSFDVVFPINYLWSAVACLTFLILLRQQRLSAKFHIPLFLFAICCGNMHEGYTLPISGALFFYALFNYKSLDRQAWLLIIGFWVGTLTVALAPGTLNRATGATPESVQEFLIRKMDVIRYSKRLYLLVIALGLSWLVLGKKQLMQFVRENSIPLMTALLGYMFLFVLPYYSQRMGFPMDLFSVLVLVRLLIVTARSLDERRSTFSGVRPMVAHKARTISLFILPLVLVALMAIHVTMTVSTAQDVGEEYREMLKEYQESQNGRTHFRDIKVPHLCNSYVYRLGVPFEQGLISFTMQKEMIIE